MSPTVQQFIDAAAKQGLDLLPYAKYVAIAICSWYVACFLFAALLFGFVVYQFIKMNRDFNG